jgi:5-(carboxyamino)imidazole ribonucleotide synthase
MNEKNARFPQQGYRLGVLGGGQLGKMLGIAAADWHLPICFLDRSAGFPAGGVSPCFTEGSFAEYDDVLAFGRQMDTVTIEIEHVNVNALMELERQGIRVHPRPQALAIIKDKGLQKQFYTDHQFPTAPFVLYESEDHIRRAMRSGELGLPFVQKTRTAGYDGKGVQRIGSEEELEHLLPGPSLVERQVNIAKELAVIAARNPSGEVAAFPMVEMEFNPRANLVEFLLCPARVSRELAQEAEALAKRLIKTFDICGLLAVEFFLSEEGELLVNEVAPRPHNSGHHTIDSCATSQFQQHLRAVLDLPLGLTELQQPAVMVNILGAPEHTGPPRYEGIENCLHLPGVHLHLYGKEVTKPFRKMGHVTITAAKAEDAIQLAREVRSRLRVIAD